MRGLSAIKKREVIRLILGSILSSDLSEADLRKVADSLEYSDLPLELGQYLRLMTDKNIQNKFGGQNENSFSAKLEDILYTIQKKRLNKAEVLELIAITSPSGKEIISSRATLAANIEKAILFNGPKFADNLLEIIEDHDTRDSYLDGIDHRK